MFNYLLLASLVLATTIGKFHVRIEIQISLWANACFEST